MKSQGIVLIGETGALEGIVFGRMMKTPLTVTEIMRFADRCHGDTEVVSVTTDNPAHRCTYRDVFRRARQLANALERLGVASGDRVGSLAWNDYRHLELYFGVACAGGQALVPLTLSTQRLLKS